MARARRVKAERAAVKWAFVVQKLMSGNERPALPCVVRLTRLAPSRGLDDDNLVGSLKAIRDQVAEWIGVDDRHRDIVRYEYHQERGPWAVRIEFHPFSPEAQTGTPASASVGGDSLRTR